MEKASMETQTSRGKRTRSPDTSRPSMNLDNVSTTTTAGGDVPTVESLRDPIDPRRNSRGEVNYYFCHALLTLRRADGSELPASPTSTNSDPSLSDKLQGGAQKVNNTPKVKIHRLSYKG